MSSGSYTIAYSNPPATGQDLVLQTAPAFIGAQNNNFSVSQTFSAGIVDSGNLTVAGTSRFTGVCTFDAIPQFDAGIEVDIATLSTGALTVSGASALNGGLTVIGSVSLPVASVADSALSANVAKLDAVQTFSAVKTFSSAPVMSGASIASSSVPAASIVSASLTNTQIAPGGVGQASVSNGYADLLSAQTVAGVKTFSSAPVMSGASVGASTLPAASIVAGSITDAQISVGGIGQSSIASGYVTLSSATVQNISGVKNFSSAASFPAGLSSTGGLQVNGGTLSAQQVACTSILNSGSLTSTSITASGAVSCTTLTPSGLLTANGGLTIPAGQTLSIGGNLIGPTSQTVVVPVAGISTVNLGGFSNGEFTINLTQSMTDLTFTNPAANTEFDIFVLVSGANIQIQKNLSLAPITIYNNLAGNQNAANGSRWWFRGKFISLTVCYIEIINVT